ncbi:unnamed protein product [Brassica napus]|uniref:(rape) hypothetical protein n=1 Tax=Brassica napus TaxID=3708 RepID=A0A816JYV4_BRANA|nr:unnamed protein product [Brassica napus]
MKRKHPTPTRADYRKRSQTQYKQKPVSDKTRDVPLSTVFPRLLNDIRSNFASSRATQSNASQVTFEKQHTPNHTFSETKTRDTTRNSGTSKNVVTEHELPNDDQENEAFQATMDEYSDLEFECSSQEQCDTDTSDDEQPSIDLEPVKDNQSDRVNFLAALFKKNFSEPKAKVKPVSPKEDVTFPTIPPKGVQRPNGRDVKSVIGLRFEPGGGQYSCTSFTTKLRALGYLYSIYRYDK